ncbi:MAG: hypothetical protein NZ842_14725, partial [Dehalococcoidia bacterium]|nr:hypothetical protein [Dehalococcoidia bacterium]
VFLTFKEGSVPSVALSAFAPNQPNSTRWKSNKFKNCYLPIVQPSTTNSATCIPIAGMNRRELGISGLKLFPNVQLIKRLVG